MPRPPLTRTCTVLCVAFLMVLTSCSPGSGWTLQGREVTNLDQSLASADVTWRREVVKADDGAIVPDTARCYYQVIDKVMVESLLCGPVHPTGSAGAAWFRVPIYAAGDPAVVTLSKPAAWKLGTAEPGATVVRADGTTTADLNPVGDEPVGPVVRTGDVYAFPAILPSTAVRLVVPTGTVSVSLVQSGPVVGTGTTQRHAPQGLVLHGAIVQTAASGGAPTGVSIRLVVGRRTIDVSEASGVHQYMTPGAPDEKVRVEVIYDGKAQVVDSSGRVGDAAAGYYDGLERSAGMQFSGENRDVPSQILMRRPASVFTLRREAYLAPNNHSDKALRWPSDGNTWLVVSGRAGCVLKDWSSGKPYDQEVPTVTMAVTVRGEVIVPTKTVAKGVAEGVSEVTFIFEIPAGVETLELAGSVQCAGTPPSSRPGTKPTQLAFELVSTPVTFAKGR